MKQFALLTLILAAACGGDDNATPDAASTDSPAGDAAHDSPATDGSSVDAPPSIAGIVSINEIIPSNTSACSDESGEFDDFIELYNSGSSAIDLGGFTITDDLTDPNKATLPSGLVIGAHAYLQLWADDTIAQGSNHLPFKLSASGESVGLYAADGSVVDMYTFGAATDDQSFERYPDGSGAFSVCATATCGLSNGTTCDMPPPVDGGIPDAPPGQVLHINEVMPSNTASCPDENQVANSDWFEIYNSSNAAIDLGGYYLTDSAALPTQFQVGAGVMVPPHGVKLFFADGATTAGANGNHTNFKLSKTAEAVLLYSSTGELIASLAWTAADNAADDVSLERLPDGSTTFSRCMTGTCGALNGGTCTPAAREETTK